MKLCDCGCGEPAPIATMTNNGRGAVKGQPLRFVHGHGGRLTPDERLARFWARVDKTGDCWVWTGNIANTGYGRLNFAGCQTLAHRLAYTLVVGEIPEGLTLDHLCRNRACVNPEHLEPVTRGENVRRGLKGRLVTHCAHGHEYTPENTLRRGSAGHRACRTCKRERDGLRPTSKAGRRAIVGVAGAWSASN